ncbi:hypothetical protein PHYBLDRAFT_141391 [Phycomyces blakesleeanus NRRL 1555(-)]|uniref:Uncharacterized protein n=1 Tax=Phycomyces blakesleeanus (strain ATCC 8743b / DSM 1359 / FGSC 10004 / NBRC 33097 / NRRL 1555) TaxID=763407 RepID=A0A162PZQ6_PHYB8|nr:hypothetical protein PHYBLDRAFT_141391 [Phycomyces blakesleeanus NRRL 1555(-)]OAD77507.1 hypothetical protein PHYBLDRAFT_141391 [Phycomyces blakesleeanus NRRL 1555(-)]|eukprot:XP_018295547.1 hypothetical protein PHYBLDRAFT_141391 [Phycomyces blakesleeanus NRRL 1555(-)]
MASATTLKSCESKNELIDSDQKTGENEKRNADYRTLLFSSNKVLRHDLSENISDIVRQKLEKANWLTIIGYK